MRVGRAAKVKACAYDVAGRLRTPEEMAACLDAWLEEAPEDISGVARVLGDIARAKGVSLVAREAGRSRKSLHGALGADGNPSFATVLKVAKALGVRIHAQAAWPASDAEHAVQLARQRLAAVPDHLYDAPAEHSAIQ